MGIDDFAMSLDGGYVEPISDAADIILIIL